MSSGCYTRTSEMKTGKYTRTEKHRSLSKDLWKDDKVREKRILGMKLAWTDDRKNADNVGGKGEKRGSPSEKTEEKRKKTWLAKYGFENPNQRPEIRKKQGNVMKNGHSAYMNSFPKSKASQGDKRHNQSVDHRRKTSEAQIKRWSSKLLREVQSKKMTESYSSGLRAGGCKTYWFWSNKNQKKIYYQSSYELASFELLEKMSIVTSYERCPYIIDYEFEGKPKKYIPDILITYDDRRQEVVEIKSKYGLTILKNVIKHETAKNFFSTKGIEFSVWTEENLFN